MGADAPAVSPTLPDIVMGDLSTDPYRFVDFDESALDWSTRVPLDPSASREHGLAFVSPIGEYAPGSYGGNADLDHVLSDTRVGACDVTLMDPSTEHPIYAPAYFDHRPVVCELQPRRGDPVTP